MNNIPQNFRPTLLPPGVYLNAKAPTPPPQDNSVSLNNQTANMQQVQAQQLYTSAAPIPPGGPDKDGQDTSFLNAGGHHHIEAPEVNTEVPLNGATTAVGQVTNQQMGQTSQATAGMTNDITATIATATAAGANIAGQVVNEVKSTADMVEGLFMVN